MIVPETKMNELDLIREVEKRPILYDKSVSGFNKTKLRDDAWKEVQDSLNVSEMECKKRWRSLRDSFIKLQRTHGGRTRWPYNLAMSFLLPHVDPSIAKQQCDLPKQQPREKDHSDESDQEEEKPRNLPDLSFAVDTRMSSISEDEASQSPAPKKARQNSTEEEITCQCRTDPDELFLLSCAPTLKRLSSKKNAVARLKIQQVLYEAEFGGANDVRDMPYITATSDFNYDISP